MRKSLVVLLGLGGAAIALVVVAVTGNLSERTIAVVLLAAGILLIASRKGIVQWAHSVGAQSKLLSHWQLLRPLAVILVGSGLIVFAGIAFFEAAKGA